MVGRGGGGGGGQIIPIDLKLRRCFTMINASVIICALSRAIEMSGAIRTAQSLSSWVRNEVCPSLDGIFI